MSVAKLPHPYHNPSHIGPHRILQNQMYHTHPIHNISRRITVAYVCHILVVSRNEVCAEVFPRNGSSGSTEKKRVQISWSSFFMLVDIVQDTNIIVMC